MYKKATLILFLICVVIKAEGQEALDTDSLIIRDIIIEGNFITSKKVILRELDFVINQTLTREELTNRKQISINNLTKTSLFNFVEIDVVENPGHTITLIFKLTERWFIWPTFYLNQTDRNFSEWWRTKDLDKLEYGIGVKINNFRGLGESLLVNYHIGNFTKIILEYKGLYFDKAKRHSLSLLASYSAQNILPWNVQINKEVVLKQTKKLIQGTDIALKYKYRKGYFNTHSVELGYTDFKIADTIYSMNPLYAGMNNHGQRYLHLKYVFTSDTRDSRIYPKTGYLFTAIINKKGLGIQAKEFNAIDINLLLYKYLKLKNRFYFASGIWYSYNWTENYNFSASTGLGYMQFVRGYEYYAVNGNNALLLKGLVKYELLPKKVINLNIWPIRKLHQFNKVPLEVYFNLFFDAGYVTDRFGIYKIYSNSLVNKMMYSTGAGIDFVTYYDKVLRFDYSFNGLGERGLFIHWKAAIR